uniref:DNA-binding protein n=1 Tax=Maridesulfovibrio bastinii TaxID=47157 RepID=UPI0004854FF6
MSKYYSTAEIAQCIELTVMTVTRRAKREGWPSRARSGKGGGKEYAFDGLPESVQTAILKAEAEKAPAIQIEDNKGPRLENLSDKKRATALARADLVALYTDHIDRATRGSKTDARAKFISAYQAGAWSRILEILGPNVSWKTIERWKLQLCKNKTVVAIADKRGIHNSSHSVMTDEHENILL